MSEWQPIETAPKDGTVSLIYCGPDEGEIPEPDGLPEIYVGRWERWSIRRPAGSKSDGRFVTHVYEDDGENEIVRPTHWLPLPPLPNPPLHKGDE